MKAPQQSLKNWSDQKWRTKSGKPSSRTGERYLPEAAIKALTPSEYAATTKTKKIPLTLLTLTTMKKFLEFFN